MEIRRVVTGVGADGKSRIVSDGQPPRTHDHVYTPGFNNSMVWATEEPPGASNDGADPTAAVTATIPAAGGSRLIVIEIPPDSSHESEGIDPELAFKEMAEHSPGLPDFFESDSPFHTTPSVDYHLMLSGELWLVLDEGETRLGPGDIVIQNGTRHLWQNRGDVPARFVTVPLGGQAATEA